MKYLILAQPKSASTSLLKTLGEIIGESYGQQVVSGGDRADNATMGKSGVANDKVLRKVLSAFGLERKRKDKNLVSFDRLRDDYPAVHYPLLSTIHVDICDFKTGKIDFGPVYTLHKQHFPPTDGNLVAFRNIPKIVLIRDADEAIGAYSRMKSLPGYFRFLIANNKDFRDALKSEIIAWQDGWKAEVEQNGGLLLTFEDVTKRTQGSLNLALREFGIAKSDAELQKIELARERYTGGLTGQT